MSINVNTSGVILTISFALIGCSHGTPKNVEVVTSAPPGCEKIVELGQYSDDSEQQVVDELKRKTVKNGGNTLLKTDEMGEEVYGNGIFFYIGRGVVYKC